MATMRNPTNQNTSIDLLPVIEKLVPAYGLIADSGLFREINNKTNSAVYEIMEDENVKMTKLTSRTERDAVKVGRGKSKYVTVAGETIKIVGGVHVEDLQNRLNSFNIEQDETLQQAIADETAAMYNSWAQSYEYMLVTASQGIMRDPLDGSAKINMFTNTGTTQSTATIDASPDSTTLISDINALRNQINYLNNGQGSVTAIDVWVAEDVFNAIVGHPEFAAIYQLALQGRGQEALANRILNGTANVPTYTQYGWSNSFVWQNITFRTYPQTFTRMDGSVAAAVANGKGWTVARGVTNAYEVLFAPAPYFSQLNSLGQKLYARSTGIIDDTHLDMTIESHLTPILKRPELCIDVTFTLT